MCLQDIKLGKEHDPSGRQIVVAADNAAVPAIVANSARRYIRFSLGADPIGLAGAVSVWWRNDGVPTCLGFIGAPNYMLELWLGRHGMVVYGPFAVVGVADAGFPISVYDTQAHTDEEKVK